QNDWPLTDAGGQNGGYTQGCCRAAGYLFIPGKGGGGARGGYSKETNYWEGNFHWNDPFSSQFVNPDTQGEPQCRRQYVVATNQIGKTLTWTISNREDGTAVDLWLFSTHPDLMDNYSQDELDRLLLNSGGSNNPGVSLTGSRVGKNVIISWPVSAA